jgi:hypothetical protein
VAHLIHISSLSVVQDEVLRVSEHAPIKTNPRRSGANAAAKIVAETCLQHDVPGATKLTMVRPALIIAGDMVDPMGSIAVTGHGGQPIVIGRWDRQRPIIVRSTMNRALVRVVDAPPAAARECLLFVDGNSPSCLLYVQAFCNALHPGIGARHWPFVKWAPFFVWKEALRSPTSLLSHRLWRSLRERNAKRTYDPTRTEERLQMTLSADWRATLAEIAVRRRRQMGETP